MKGEKMMDKNEDKLGEKTDFLKENVDQTPAVQKATNRSMRKAISPYFPSAPVPLVKPTIEDDFNNHLLLERVTESIKYNILCLEYSISPKGGLRQWVKINISLLLLLGIPILIFVPLATYLMGGFSDIAELLANSTQFLLASAINILQIIGVLIVIASIIYIIFKLMALRFGSRGGQSGDVIDVTPDK